MNAHWLDFYFIMCLKQIKSGWHDVIFAIREKTSSFQHAILEAYDLELEVVVFLFHMSIRRKFEADDGGGYLPIKNDDKTSKNRFSNWHHTMRLLQVNPISCLKVGFNEFTSRFAEDMMNQQFFFSLHSAKNQMEEHFTDVQSMYSVSKHYRHHHCPYPVL